MAGMSPDLRALVKKRNQEIIELDKCGWSGTRIARHFCLSTQRICEIIRDANMKENRSVYDLKKHRAEPDKYPCGIEKGQLRISKPDEQPRPETCAGQGCYHTHCGARRNYLVKFPDNQQGRIIPAPFNHANGSASRTN